MFTPPVFGDERYGKRGTRRPGSGKNQGFCRRGGLGDVAQRGR